MRRADAARLHQLLRQRVLSQHRVGGGCINLAWHDIRTHGSVLLKFRAHDRAARIAGEEGNHCCLCGPTTNRSDTNYTYYYTLPQPMLGLLPIYIHTHTRTLVTWAAVDTSRNGGGGVQKPPRPVEPRAGRLYKSSPRLKSSQPSTP